MIHIKQTLGPFSLAEYRGLYVVRHVLKGPIQQLCEKAWRTRGNCGSSMDVRAAAAEDMRIASCLAMV